MSSDANGARPAPAGPAYGAPARFLHWLTFLLLLVQFVVGYALERSDDLLGWLVDRWLSGEEDRLVLVHLLLGTAILLLAVVRLAWRRRAGLPPWAPGLSAFERRLAHRVEQVLYVSLFVIPLTGIALVLLSGEDWELGATDWRAPLELVDDDVLLAAHITGHLLFFAAFAAHVGLVLKHQLVDRDRLLRRML